MFLIIACILLIGWVAGLVTSITLGGLIHIALALAIILIIIWLLKAVFKLI
ncbi:MAG: lmo0937 family membrane protein [Spirochaetes bacterium]|nr:lmo0937 family membrane protein [Spirochaetota bacterium]